LSSRNRTEEAGEVEASQLSPARETKRMMKLQKVNLKLVPLIRLRKTCPAQGTIISMPGLVVSLAKGHLDEDHGSTSPETTANYS
jgi:hypothetical protein